MTEKEVIGILGPPDNTHQNDKGGLLFKVFVWERTNAVGRLSGYVFFYADEVGTPRAMAKQVWVYDRQEERVLESGDLTFLKKEKSVWERVVEMIGRP